MNRARAGAFSHAFFNARARTPAVMYPKFVFCPLSRARARDTIFRPDKDGNPARDSERERYRANNAIPARRAIDLPLAQVLSLVYNIAPPLFPRRDSMYTSARMYYICRRIFRVAFECDMFWESICSCVQCYPCRGV